MTSDDHSDTVEGSVDFTSKTSKTIKDHILGLLTEPLQLLLVSVTIFGSIWGVYEAISSTLMQPPNRTYSLSLIFIGSIALSLLWRVINYFNTCPDGLETLSKNARRIAHLQRPKWQARFAKSVLSQLIGPIDRQYQELLDGKVYVICKRFNGFREYNQWAMDHSTNMTRMINVATKLVLHELSPVLTSTQTTQSSPKDLLASLVSIQRFYQEALEYEKSVQRIIPPIECENLHSLLSGGTQNHLAFIHQIFEFLEQIIDSYDKDVSHFKFSFSFGRIANMDEILSEYNKLRLLLPQIMEGETQ